MVRGFRYFFALFCTLSLSNACLAGFGLNAIANGGEAHAMGSADLARSHSGIGANTNPAGLTGVEKGNFSVYGEGFYYSDWGHRDSLGNDQTNTPDVTLVGGGGIAHRLAGSPNWVFGMAFTAQGGVGFDYPELRVENGGRDRLSATFGVFRFAPAVAWQVNDKLSVGGSFGLNISEAEQKVFPETSIPASADDPGFVGADIQGLFGISYSYRLGMQYQLTDNVRIGMAYGSPTKLKLEGGRARLNFAAQGLGKVQYNDARVEGLNLAEEFGVGVAWQVKPRTLIAADLNWYNWSEALDSSRLTLRRAEGPVPAELRKVVQESPLDLSSHVGVSLGVRHQFSEDTVLMAGFAYAANPFPPQYTVPTLNLVAEQHLTFGLSQDLGNKWRVVATYYFIPRKSITRRNAELPLGEFSTEYASGHDFTVTFERNW